MLPLIKLDLTELCCLGNDEGRCVIISQNTYYVAVKVEAAAASQGNNIDRFFTKAILAGMAINRVKGPLVFWFAPLQGLFLLSFTDKRLKSKCWWRLDIPGYYEQGQAPLPQHAAPFIYYDGSNIYRIYPLPNDFETDKHYLSDFCGMGGLYVGETDEDMYEYVRTNPVEKYDYSIVPRENEEILTINGKKHVLLHAFWRPD